LAWLVIQEMTTAPTDQVLEMDKVDRLDKDHISFGGPEECLLRAQQCQLAHRSHCHDLHSGIPTPNTGSQNLGEVKDTEVEQTKRVLCGATFAQMTTQS
jgi:hypothetical protein